MPPKGLFLDNHGQGPDVGLNKVKVVARESPAWSRQVFTTSLKCLCLSLKDAEGQLDLRGWSAYHGESKNVLKIRCCLLPTTDPAKRVPSKYGVSLSSFYSLNACVSGCWRTDLRTSVASALPEPTTSRRTVRLSTSLRTRLHSAPVIYRSNVSNCFLMRKYRKHYCTELSEVFTRYSSSARLNDLGSE
jgi:hypothetical protein